VAFTDDVSICRIPINEDESTIKGFIASLCPENSSRLIIQGKNFVNLPDLPPQTLENFTAIMVAATNIQSFGTLFMAGPFDNLTRLYLMKNRVTTLDDYTFAGATRLEVIDVSNNLLNELSDESLNGLEALKVLDLSGNCITCLPIKLFENMPQLTVVRLGDNNLQHMDLNIFSENRKLSILSLERNNINAVEPANSQLAVEKLLLQDNNLIDISGLRSVDQLVILDLSENPNVHLEEETFDSVPRLVELGLNNVSFLNVKSIERLFSPLNEVKEIKLARNRLTELEMDMILNIKSLNVLILENPDSRNYFTESFINSGKKLVSNIFNNLTVSDILPESWRSNNSNNKLESTKIGNILLDKITKTLNGKKIKFQDTTHVHKQFKNCPKMICPTENIFTIPVIIGLTLTVLVIICTAIGLVYYYLTKHENPWFLANSYSTRDLPDPEYVIVEPNLIYDWNTTTQGSNNEETEEPGYDRIVRISTSSNNEEIEEQSGYDRIDIIPTQSTTNEETEKPGYDRIG
jgi:Leucine rich repeat